MQTCFPSTGQECPEDANRCSDRQFHLGNWWIQGTCDRKNRIKPERSIHKQWILLGWEALEDAAICKTSNMQNVRANAVSSLTSAYIDIPDIRLIFIGSKTVLWIDTGPLIRILLINSFLCDLISQICHLWNLWRCCDLGQWDDVRRSHDRNWSFPAEKKAEKRSGLLKVKIFLEKVQLSLK